MVGDVADAVDRFVHLGTMVPRVAAFANCLRSAHVTTHLLFKASGAEFGAQVVAEQCTQARRRRHAVDATGA